MSLLRNITSGLRSLFRRDQVDRELNEELRAYLEMEAAEKMKQGMSRKDALRAVRLEQGSLDVSKEVVRAAGWESFVETCWQDLRFGFRQLRKNGGLTIFPSDRQDLEHVLPQGTDGTRRWICSRFNNANGTWRPGETFRQLGDIGFLCGPGNTTRTWQVILT